MAARRDAFIIRMQSLSSSHREKHEPDQTRPVQLVRSNYALLNGQKESLAPTALHTPPPFTHHGSHNKWPTSAAIILGPLSADGHEEWLNVGEEGVALLELFCLRSKCRVKLEKMLKTSATGFSLSRKKSLTSLTEMQNRVTKNAQQKERKRMTRKKCAKNYLEFNKSYEKNF